jgi:hypothetical protein
VELGEHLEQPGHGRHTLPHRLQNDPVAQFQQALRRFRQSQFLGKHPHRIDGRPPHHPAQGLVRDGLAKSPRHFPPGRPIERLAVDHQPVHVKNDRGDDPCRSG